MPEELILCSGSPPNPPNPRGSMTPRSSDTPRIIGLQEVQAEFRDKKATRENQMARDKHKNISK